jgi:P2 family phage contractile tail tube protein
MKRLPQFLTGVSVFVGGVGILGTSNKASLPKVDQMRETIIAGGFERNVGAGVFKAMEAEITFDEFHSSTYSALGSSVLKNPSFVIKGSLKQNETSIPLQATIKGSFDLEDTLPEVGKKVEQKLSIKVDYYSLELNKKQVVEMDLDNMIAKIDDKDYLEELRQHITG